MSKKRRRKNSPSPSGRVSRVAGPRSRLRGAFEIIGQVAEEADRCVPHAAVDAESGRVFASMFVRGINCVKAVRAQLELAHWETAAGTSRQLFELLLNAEYIVTNDDTDALAFRYAKFGLLQMALHQQATMTYDEKRGSPANAERKRVLDGWLAGPAFEEFRAPKTHDGWATTWSGQSAWKLATLSSSPIRQDQYNLMFRSWSEQAHAAPAALLPGMFARGGPDWEREVVAEDDARVLEAIAITVTFFLELWYLLPPFAPLLDSASALKWTTRLVELGMGSAGATS